ncbi:MAG TPA: hypothetical protein VFV19_04780 [Candidatus Polarisedimenticolaceae bacterium]|nr:hypothetical protein [Candidatus Polarisedimenticolaceae bacterium]
MSSRDLVLGIGTVRFDGWTAAAARAADERWGGFVRPPSPSHAPDLVAEAVRGNDEAWLPPWEPGERYRIEAEGRDGTLIVRSYGFNLMRRGDGVWTVAFKDDGAEPLGRVVDNVARYLVARLALAHGGIPLHGAAVRRGGHAYVFAGPSRAGKSTAARVSAPAAESLGDDFAVVVPHGHAWATCALPFDNAERAPESPLPGLVPLSKVCRLYQAQEHAVQAPGAPLAQASLLSCLAFPWAWPDAIPAAEASIDRLVEAGKLVHLHFSPDDGFWKLIE